MADIALKSTLAKRPIRDITAWDRLKVNRDWLGFWFMLPALGFLVLFLAYPLGLGIWRRNTDLLPFFWSANGITSMFASVLGMALSIEFGIAKTYTLGVCCYVLCALTIAASRWTQRAGVSAAMPAGGSVSVGPDGSPLLLRDRGTQDVYSLDWLVP